MWRRGNILLCKFFRKFKKVILTLSYKPKQTTMNRLKTQHEKNLELLAERQKQYAKESLGFGWFFAIIITAMILTAIVENI